MQVQQQSTYPVLDDFMWYGVISRGFSLACESIALQSSSTVDSLSSSSVTDKLIMVSSSIRHKAEISKANRM